MAFDGITISCIIKELNDNILNGRIAKIAQPEADEILLTIKGIDKGQQRLLISASASLPLVYFTENSKPSPITAPAFCMLLRKHISNGRIVSISQPGLERIINIEIEHLNELGDLCKKTLVVELMGKHSNIIFLDDKGMILDAIKHIPSFVSSVREVLPGRDYFIPHTDEKLNLLNTDEEELFSALTKAACPVYKALYSSYTGISPFYAHEICYMAGIDGDDSTVIFDSPSSEKFKALFAALNSTKASIIDGSYSPCILYENSKPYEYSVLSAPSFLASSKKEYSSISCLLESYYKEKAQNSRMRQKSSDLRKIIDTLLERDIKKYDLQLKQIEDTQKKDEYKLYGELLNVYGYNAEENSKSITVMNYYTNEDITIPLDPTLSALENAQKYFGKYNKLKRTKEALEELIKEVKAQIDHLESIQAAMDIAVSEEDLSAIKEEMIGSGYIKRHASEKKAKLKSKPFHYVSKEGFHIYVGKNNLQNEELTFSFANGGDWWFHAKKTPGSHVILKTEGREVPDSVFEDAARLAAHYSKAKGSEKVEVDYVKRKEVKHPNGAKPGFVVYYTNYSMTINTDISHLELIED